MSDFEIMLLRKKEERTRRKKRRDIDIINDNDDLIAQLLQNMKTAAEVSYINLLRIVRAKLVRFDTSRRNVLSFSVVACLLFFYVGGSLSGGLIVVFISRTIAS